MRGRRGTSEPLYRLGRGDAVAAAVGLGVQDGGQAVAEDAMTPRFIRLRDAPAYLGMGPSTFDALVRKHVHEVPIAIDPTTDRRTGIAFDRLELDAWASDYVRRYGRPPVKQEETWQGNEALTRPAKRHLARGQTGLIPPGWPTSGKHWSNYA